MIDKFVCTASYAKTDKTINGVQTFVIQLQRGLLRKFLSTFVLLAVDTHVSAERRADAGYEHEKSERDEK